MSFLQIFGSSGGPRALLGSSLTRMTRANNFHILGRVSSGKVNYCTCNAPRAFVRTLLSMSKSTLRTPGARGLIGPQGPVRHFRTSSPNNIPALAWVVIRAVGKIAAILTGRRFRTYWKSLPPEKKAQIYQWLRKNRLKFALGLPIPGGAAYLYYYSHLQETPITGRRRFICFTPAQFVEIADLEYQSNLMQFEKRMLPPFHPLCKRVEVVAMRLLNANKDIAEIFEKKWSIVVVNADEIKNAFVLPNGIIFVFTGMLKMVANDDQLATVLAHEMSHAILNHGAELLSLTHFLDFFLVCALALIWAVLPTDLTAAITAWLFDKIMKITLELPYSRKLETEADVVGLELAAKACFDVREAAVFWKMMSLTDRIHYSELFGHQSTSDLPEKVEFLSTHPSHDARAEYIENLLPKAVELRQECKCPPLPRMDPALIFEGRKKLFEKRMQLPREMPPMIILTPR